MELPSEKERLRAYAAGMEAVERVRAQELAAMTDERAWEIITSLVAAETPWRENREWSGLVEQQAIFARWGKR
jgi:hypothetical protein